MESIIEYLRRRLKEVGQTRWGPIGEEISDEAGLSGKERITFHSLRKIAYGERTNPGLQDTQRVLDYFASVDRGERDLPEPVKAD